MHALYTNLFDYVRLVRTRTVPGIFRSVFRIFSENIYYFVRVCRGAFGPNTETDDESFRLLLSRCTFYALVSIKVRAFRVRRLLFQNFYLNIPATFM